MTPEEIRNQALDEAANVCETYANEKWSAYKTGFGPERANPYYEGQSDAADALATFIRELKSPAPTPPEQDSPKDSPIGLKSASGTGFGSIEHSPKASQPSTEQPSREAELLQEFVSLYDDLDAALKRRESDAAMDDDSGHWANYWREKREALKRIKERAAQAHAPAASSADMQEENACAYRRDDGTNCECGWPSTRCREYVQASTPTANGAA